MRAASSDVLLLQILLIPSRIVIFNGFPHRSPQFQQRPHFFFYLSLSHPRIIISQLFEELKEEKRKSTVEAQPLQYFYKCISPLLERDKRFFRSMPYLKRANISSTQFIWRRFEKTRRWNNFREKILRDTIFQKRETESLRISRVGNRNGQGVELNGNASCN